jgi:hypothetical protein
MDFGSKSKLSYDRQSIGQSVWPQLSPLTHFSFSLKHLFLSTVAGLLSPSLTRRRVCNLLLLLNLGSAVPLGSESHLLLSQFETPISSRNRVAQLYPRALGTLYVASYDSQGYGGGTITLPQLVAPGSRIYMPQGQGGIIIPPGTGYPLRRLSRLAGLRWGYSNPPPTGRARLPNLHPPGTGWYNYTPGHGSSGSSGFTHLLGTVLPSGRRVLCRH